MPAAIRTHSLTKHFPRSGRLTVRALLRGLSEDERFTAVNDLSLEVPKGEVVGILGRNGAGKSTLLRLVGGIYSADQGSVVLAGDVAGLFELGGFGNSQLTGRAFAQRYLQLFGVRRALWKQLLAEICEFSELGDYFDERIHTYSAGMGARLYFATATAVPHDIYLIDEILSVGDEHFQAKSWARVKDRLARGASGLLVTHDWSAVIKLCRHSKVLDRGRIAMAGPSDEMVARYLDFPRPPADRARLLPPPPEGLQALSGEDFALVFRVQLSQSIATEAAVSIETLQLGVGWEPIILTEFERVANVVGVYEVRIAIAALPLAPGDYSLNLFLATPVDPATGAREALDTRGWTYGTALALHVGGHAAGSGIAPIPLRWAIT